MNVRALTLKLFAAIALGLCLAPCVSPSRTCNDATFNDATFTYDRAKNSV